MRNDGMVRFIGFLGCCLVGIFGLVPNSFAQASAALAACQADMAYWEQIGLNWVQYNPENLCVHSAPSCSPHTRVVDGQERSGYVLNTTWGRADATVPCVGGGSAASNQIGSPGSSGPGFTRSSFQFGNPALPPYGGGYYFFYWSDEEEPVPECQAGITLYSWKAATPSGTGEICLNYCSYDVFISAPPGPLYEAVSNGRGCAQEDNGIPYNPDSDPFDPDSEDPGTRDPSDPEAPPNSGGGGFHCDAPPVCNSDGVTCSTLYQQWRTRCDAERSDAERRDQLDRIGDGIDRIGDGLEGLDGLGDSIDGLGNSIDGLGEGLDGLGDSIDGLNDGIDRIGDGVDGLRSDLESGWSDGGVGDPGDGPGGFGGVIGNRLIDPSGFDDSGFGFPRSCPMWDDISFSVPNGSVIVIPLSDFEGHCLLFEITGWIILAFAAFWSARIIMTGS